MYYHPRGAENPRRFLCVWAAERAARRALQSFRKRGDFAENIFLQSLAQNERMGYTSCSRSKRRGARYVSTDFRFFACFRSVGRVAVSSFVCRVRLSVRAVLFFCRNFSRRGFNGGTQRKSAAYGFAGFEPRRSPYRPRDGGA